MKKASHNLRRRKGTQTSRGPYISFGMKSTTCLAIFLIIYAISVLCLIPALKDDEKAQRIKNARDRIIRKEKALIGHVKKEGQAWKDEINNVRRRGREAVEKDLMEKALEKLKMNTRPHPKKNTGKVSTDEADLEQKEAPQDNRRKYLDKGIHVKKKSDGKQAANKKVPQDRGGNNIDKNIQPKVEVKDSSDKEKPTAGFVVLGMHRSGTSMLSGLLVEGFGYHTGWPLIGPAFDNQKGFFELIPAVLQNDEFMYEQNINWASNVGNYNPERALNALKTRKITFEKGTKALKILNDPANVPWLQKDPRMCITLRTWLPLLNSKPAVLFTYRNPLEVAMSLAKREAGFTIMRGLRLWIKYNKAAVQNSLGLCIVKSNNNAVFSDPLGETTRIVEGLTECGVPASPTKITQKIIDGFVDPNLQHNKKKLEKKSADQRILETYNGDCEVKDFDSKLDGNKNKLEKDMYLKAMKIYCDFESGAAYEKDYIWPDV